MGTDSEFETVFIRFENHVSNSESVPILFR